jgi:hypothetical protein
MPTKLFKRKLSPRVSFKTHIQTRKFRQSSRCLADQARTRDQLITCRIPGLPETGNPRNRLSAGGVPSFSTRKQCSDLCAEVQREGARETYLVVSQLITLESNGLMAEGMEPSTATPRINECGAMSMREQFRFQVRLPRISCGT